MRLNLDQIVSITCGAVKIEKIEDAYRFYRFSKHQMDAYLNSGFIDFYHKTYATSGVRFAFKTNSKYIDIEYRFKYGSSRDFGYFDVIQNNKIIDHFGLKGDESPRKHRINLEGCMPVEIYFPWSKACEIILFEIEDNSYIIPIKRNKTIINFGDSITQGYDVIYPSKSYANKISKLIDADCYNKGIGGDIFFPNLVLEKEELNPDYITIAYGTNDWSKCTPEMFYDNAKKFINNVSTLYPNSKIFVISPIWRGDYNENTFFHEDVTIIDRILRGICDTIDNTIVVDGFNLVSHDEKYYVSDLLHPNDLGFEEYASNLYLKIKEYL